jgi:hypothetical protein
MNSVLKAPGTKRLKQKIYKLPSNVALKFNLRHYTGGGMRVGVHASPLRTPPPAPIAVAVLGQGLTLIYFSAQPQSFGHGNHTM